MKLTYWTAEHLKDSNVYSIREETKKAAEAEKAASPNDFGPVNKVEIEYFSAFDLLTLCLSEGNGFWEPVANDPDTLV